MSPRDFIMRLEDILDAIGKIQAYVDGMDFKQFKADSRTVDAIVRNITIIGEAARHVPEGIVNRYKDIPWLEMQDIRNVVVHEYFGISLDILWETIQHDLPPLIEHLKRVIKAENPRNSR